MLTRKFGRKKAHRNHMLRNLAASVILYEKVVTTEAKGKEIKRMIDRSITLAKKNNLAARRHLESIYFDSNVVSKLFDVLISRYADRPSGFTRVLRLGNRVGDNASKVQITLIPEVVKEETAKPAKAARKAAPAQEEKESDDAKSE